MLNQIETITKYSQQGWDKVYKQESVTSLLDSDPIYTKFEGAKTVKIAKFQNGGLSNYYRNNAGDDRIPTPPADGKFVGAASFGYQSSPARLVWEEFTLKCDRAAAFEIEYFDNEESGGELVGMGVTEISRTALVPEVDAYCLSTIADYAKLGGKVVNTALESKPLTALNAAFQYMEEHEVPADDQLIYASPAFMNLLRNTSEVYKALVQEDYKASKDIRFKIEQYEGRTIVTVAPQRFRTDINLYDGGYSWKAGSQAIDFMVLPKSAVSHIVKYDKIKVIGGDTNLAARGFDGYTVFVRIYHDVFVPDNKRVALYVHVSGTAATTETSNVTIDIKTKGTGAATEITSINTLPNDALCFVVTSTDTGKKVGETLSNYTVAKKGDKVGSSTATSAVYYAMDSNKRILAMVTVAQGA